MKKFDALGKNLTKEEQKRIMGGVRDESGGCEDECQTSAGCSPGYKCELKDCFKSQSRANQCVIDKY